MRSAKGSLNPARPRGRDRYCNIRHKSAATTPARVRDGHGEPRAHGAPPKHAMGASRKSNSRVSRLFDTCPLRGEGGRGGTMFSTVRQFTGWPIKARSWRPRSRSGCFEELLDDPAGSIRIDDELNVRPCLIGSVVTRNHEPGSTPSGHPRSMTVTTFTFRLGAHPAKRFSGRVLAEMSFVGLTSNRLSPRPCLSRENSNGSRVGVTARLAWRKNNHSESRRGVARVRGGRRRTPTKSCRARPTRLHADYIAP